MAEDRIDALILACAAERLGRPVPSLAALEETVRLHLDDMVLLAQTAMHHAAGVWVKSLGTTLFLSGHTYMRLGFVHTKDSFQLVLDHLRILLDR
jgi:hypothetical protein